MLSLRITTPDEAKIPPPAARAPAVLFPTTAALVIVRFPLDKNRTPPPLCVVVGSPPTSTLFPAVRPPVRVTPEMLRSPTASPPAGVAKLITLDSVRDAMLSSERPGPVIVSESVIDNWPDVRPMVPATAAPANTISSGPARPLA